MGRRMNWEKSSRDRMVADRGSYDGPGAISRDNALRLPKPITTKQRAYIRSLAERLGEEPKYPPTSRLASEEIERLKRQLDRPV